MELAMEISYGTRRNKHVCLPHVSTRVARQKKRERKGLCLWKYRTSLLKWGCCCLLGTREKKSHVRRRAVCLKFQRAARREGRSWLQNLTFDRFSILLSRSSNLLCPNPKVKYKQYTFSGDGGVGSRRANARPARIRDQPCGAQDTREDWIS